MEKFDVVIVGGHMVGATLAASLQGSGLKVALLERMNVPETFEVTQAMRLRVSAVIRASENILRHCGAWDRLIAARMQAYTDMHVWEGELSHAVHFDAADVGEKDLGTLVENDHIQWALWQELRAQQKVDLMEGVSIQSIDTVAREITLEDGRQICADLIVGADGARSMVRESAGIEWIEKPYQQFVMVGNVRTEQSHQNTCWQRYNDDNPFAFLPLADGSSSIAWYMPVEQKEWASGLGDDEFKQALNEASGLMLGHVSEVGARGGFELVKRRAGQMVSEGIALVGDAAHTIHPMAGQGANLGFIDAATLAEELIQAHQRGESISRVSVLKRYERRRSDTAWVQNGMDVIKQLFVPVPAPLQWLRERSLPVMNKITPVKTPMTQFALGFGRDLPRSARKNP